MIFKNGFNYILMNVATAPVDCCNRPHLWGQLQHLILSIQV